MKFGDCSDHRKRRIQTILLLKVGQRTRIVLLMFSCLAPRRMIDISKESVFAMMNDGGTHRKQFSHSSGVQKNKDRPTFSVPFDNCLVRHFLSGTGRRLTFNAQHNQHYCFLKSPQDILEVEAWEMAQGTRVFIRNTLTSTVALDLNFLDNETGTKTLVGAHEEAAKHYKSEESIAFLVEQSRNLIGSIDYLAKADFICGVPAPVEKGFDLPTRVAVDLSKMIEIPDITECFNVTHKPKSLKSCTLDEKWDA